MSARATKMRSALPLIVFLVCSWLAGLTHAADYSLEVTVTDIETPKGKLHVALFLSEAAYEEKAGDDGAVLPVRGSAVTHKFLSVDADECVVLLFHDVNNNGQLDTNLLGIPKEPYASSTGRRGRFGPPSWQQAKLSMHEDRQLRISLR